MPRPRRSGTAGATASATTCSCSRVTPSCWRAQLISTRPPWEASTSISPSLWPKAWSRGFTTPRMAASANAVAILALLKLGRITDRKEFTDAAEKSLRLFANRLQQVPQAVPCLLQALDFSLEETCRAVVAGDPASPEARALLRAIHSVYQPNKVVLGNTGPVEPFAKTLPASGGPVVYLCTGASCQPPTRALARIAELLKR